MHPVINCKVFLDISRRMLARQAIGSYWYAMVISLKSIRVLEEMIEHTLRKDALSWLR